MEETLPEMPEKSSNKKVVKKFQQNKTTLKSLKKEKG